MANPVIKYRITAYRDEYDKNPIIDEKIVEGISEEAFYRQAAKVLYNARLESPEIKGSVTLERITVETLLSRKIE